MNKNRKSISTMFIAALTAASTALGGAALPSALAAPVAVATPFPFAEWLNAPSSGAWTPGADNVFTVSGTANIQASVTSQTALSANTAYYAIYDPSTREYEAFPATASLSNNNKTANLTAEGVTFRGNGQTIQFFINPQGSVLPLVSPAYVVRNPNAATATPTPAATSPAATATPAGPQPTATPAVSGGPGKIALPFLLNPIPITITSFEPNNSACEAKQVEFDKEYRSFADDDDDWYYFDLPSDGLVQVFFKNYPVRPATEGEFQIYRSQSSDCNGAKIEVHGRFTDNDYPVINMGLAEQPMGRYYLRVTTRKDKNSTEPYFFKLVRAPINEWSPWIQACPQFRHCDAPKFDGTIPIYWFGMAGATKIVINGSGEAVGGCPAGKPFERTPEASELGVEKISGLAAGYYKVRMTVTAPNRPTWSNEIPVKVGCNFLNMNMAMDRR